MVSLFIAHNDVLNSILTGWCSLDALQKLDSAFCNREQRSEFLSFLVNDTFRLEQNCLKIDRPFLRWLSIRGVKFRSVSLCKRDFSGDNLTFSINTQEITRIEIADENYETGIFFGFKYRSAGRVPNEPLANVPNITQTAFLNLINSCPKLTSLVIRHTQCFNDNTVDLISQHILDQTTSITFSVSTNFTVTGLMQFVNNLEHLALYCCPGVSEHDLIQIIKATKGTLRTIHIKKICSNEFIHALSEHCPLLEKVMLPELCEGLTNITYIAHMIQNCKYLTYAYFHGEIYNCITFNKITEKSSPVLDGVDDGGGTKRILTIHGSFSDVSPTCVTDFFNVSAHMHFTEISLFRHIVTDEVLSAIRINNPSLRVLEYEFCKPTFHGYSLKSFGDSCPDLHTLSMAPVWNLSDQDCSLLFASATDCVFKNMRHLRLSESNGLTEQTVFNILCNNDNKGGMHKLERFECYAMSLFTEDCSVVTELIDAAEKVATVAVADAITAGDGGSYGGVSDATSRRAVVTAQFTYDSEPYSTLEDGYTNAGF